MSDIQTQVLVVGGGPLALMTALALKKRGIDVVVAGEAPPSHAPLNRELMLVGGDEALAPLFQHSLQCWREAEQRFGVRIPLTEAEAYDLATTKGRISKLRDEAMIDALGGEHVTYEEKAPHWAPTVQGYKRWENAPLLPLDVQQILQKAVVDAGIPQRHMNPVALSIVELSHPQISLEDGSRFQAKHIIFTSARALRRLLPPLGLALPLRPARSHVLVMRNAQPHGLPTILQRLQRGLLFMVPVDALHMNVHYDGMNDPAQATFNVNANSQLVKALQQHIGFLVPPLQQGMLVACKVSQEWLTPDFLPALGPWGGLPGVLVGSGWGGRGTAYAAGAADVLAEYVENADSPVNVQSLVPNRFANGLWQVVRQPGCLSWHEPTPEIDNSMMMPKPEYMENVTMVETPKPQYANTVNQVEKVVVENAGRREMKVKVKERRKITTAALKSGA
jgi:glycine/D-amino acid oxidase-like deaminating enzyme